MKKEFEKAGVKALPVESAGYLNGVFEVEVMLDLQTNVWVAWCDELGLVTESGSFDALIERAQAVIPELLSDHGYPVRSAAYEVIYVFVRRRILAFD